ncbi:MAG: KH domain-containing protein [Candidatus Gottesmanbacteria bacterium]
MKDTLIFLVSKIVDHPEDILVEINKEETRDILVLHVHPDDMGKVIGKQGRIIRALRDLIKLMAAKRNSYVDIELFEELIQESPVSVDTK